MDWSLLGFRGLSQFFNVHPVFVHFPIALFPTALFFYIVGISRRRNDFLLAGRICLVLGLVSTLITVFTGYWAETSFPHGETVHRMMKTHQTIGFTILGLGGLLTIWSFLKREGIPKASKLFLFLLGFVVLLILQNADLGMRMVFIEGAAVKAVSNNGEAEGENSGHHHGDENPNSHNHKEN